MNVEDYRLKIQKISNLLAQSSCPEDVLNCGDIDLKNDFQYLCFSCSCNIGLVDDVIARLAENGNRDIVEQNINHISINMWKDLFNKNGVTKELFIKNYNNITENAGIITFREIEGFIDDEQTRPLVYSNLALIIRKLCTYDRASLIAKLRTKQDGTKKIKENIENFFQKGEFDISTTYSKVLAELNEVPGISKTEILEACSKHLIDMLERETAIDNETNDLLNWIYDSMEETKMFDEQRKILQDDIDNAILDNFDSILDKSNYDKVTIKILKQFPCTYKKFENNKNLYIDKSNKLVEINKFCNPNYKTECIDKSLDNNETGIENYAEHNATDVDLNNGSHAVCIEYDEKNNDEDVETVVGNHALSNDRGNFTVCNEKACEVRGNHAIDMEDKSKNSEDIKVFRGNHAADCEDDVTINVNGADTGGSHSIDGMYNHHVDEKNGVTFKAKQEEEQSKFIHENGNQGQDIHSKVDYKEEKVEDVFDDLNVLAKFSELMEKSNENDTSGAGSYISSLIRNNIQETDRIIAQILRKGTEYNAQDDLGCSTQDETQNETQNEIQNATQNEIQNETQDETQNEIQNATQNEIQNETQNETQNDIKNETENEVQNVIYSEMKNECTSSEVGSANTFSKETANVIQEVKEEQVKDIVVNGNIEKNGEKQALVVKEDDIELPNENSIFRKIWKKVKKLFAKLKTFKIGE